VSNTRAEGGCGNGFRPRESHSLRSGAPGGGTKPGGTCFMKSYPCESATFERRDTTVERRVGEAAAEVGGGTRCGSLREFLTSHSPFACRAAAAACAARAAPPAESGPRSPGRVRAGPTAGPSGRRQH
jgi:hypothetical protein